MRYSISLDQVFILEHDLSTNAAVLLSLVHHAPSWAAPHNDGWYWLSYSAIISEAPVFLKNRRAVTRARQELQSKGIIEQRVEGNKNLFKVTDIGRWWGRKDGSISPVGGDKFGTTGGDKFGTTGGDKFGTQSDNYRSDNKRSTTVKTPPADFDRFWKAYPRKIKKQDALRAWQKLKPDTSLITKIMDNLEIQKSSSSWMAENGKYIPHPASWLNGARWEDELTPATEAPAQRDANADVPVCKIINLFHRICPNHPRVTVTTDPTLRSMIIERWQESPDQQSGNGFWVPFFQKAARRQQVFYRGQHVEPRLEALMSRAVFREIAEASQ